jgi:NitT/TauT family transport system substrate-binding protein
MPATRSRFLCGVHLGCFELFAKESIRNVRDLKRKSIAANAIGGSGPAFLVSFGAAIGFDAVRDVRWVTESTPSPMEQFAAGELDAFLAHPPEVQQSRARRIEHVLVSSYHDRPWSQYFCCMLGARSAYVRSILSRPSGLCGRCCGPPTYAAATRLGAPAGWSSARSPTITTPRATVREIGFDRWRDYDPEDTVRFYALRLHKAGMIKSTPAKIIARGSDWRFFHEVRRELKT